MGGTHGQPMLLTVAAGLLAVAVTPVQSDFRDQLLELAHQRINVDYEDDSKFEAPKVQDGVTYKVSKEDKQCGDSGVPLTYVEFELSGVRPVDAFNVMTDAIEQHSWDSSCDGFTHLADMQHMRARGVDGVFSASGPIKLSREFYEWEMADANFTTEEFWLVFSTVNNEELRQMKPPESGATNADNCLAGYRFRPVLNATGQTTGVHIVITQQLNTHPWPLTARSVAEMAFGPQLSFAKNFGGAVQKQANLGWNATRTILPDWMLQDLPCSGEAPNLNLQSSLLKKARSVFDAADKGDEQEKQVLPGGEVLQIWQRYEQCGNTEVGTSSMPMWQAEFHIPSAQPDVVFNVIANKVEEPRWNSQVNRNRLADFSSGQNDGVRGVHEELAMPPGLASWIANPRELWEWQVTNQSMEDGVYLVALASTPKSASSKFSSSSQEAVQCLAGYEVSAAAKGGTRVRLVTHPNPNVFTMVKAFNWIWSSISRKMLAKYATELTAEAKRVAGARGSAGQDITDGDILALLSPSAPGRNRSISIAQVVEAKGTDLFSKFAALDLPYVLNTSNTSSWALKDFHLHAEELSKLGQRLKANMTRSQAKVFQGGVAKDEIDVQMQGQVLSVVQQHVLQQIAVQDCSDGPGLPDINGDGKEAYSPWQLMLVGVVTVLLLLCAACVCCCFRCRRRIRQKRELRASANALLPAAGVQESTDAGPEVGSLA